MSSRPRVCSARACSGWCACSGWARCPRPQSPTLFLAQLTALSTAATGPRSSLTPSAGPQCHVAQPTAAKLLTCRTAALLRTFGFCKLCLAQSFLHGRNAGAVCGGRERGVGSAHSCNCCILPYHCTYNGINVPTARLACKALLRPPPSSSRANACLDSSKGCALHPLELILHTSAHRSSARC